MACTIALGPVAAWAQQSNSNAPVGTPASAGAQNQRLNEFSGIPLRRPEAEPQIRAREADQKGIFERDEAKQKSGATSRGQAVTEPANRGASGATPPPAAEPRR